MTNLEKIKTYLAEHGSGTAREIGAYYGWTEKTSQSQVSHAHSYWHVEVAGRQRSVASARHWELIWRLRLPAMVRLSTLPVSP